jgi:hypothetical protein
MPDPAKPVPAPRPDWRDRPEARRVAPGRVDYHDILRRHDEAMRSGQPTYLDPTSGLQVFTAEFLRSRGYCCDSACRHCPYIPASDPPPTDER